MKTKLYVWTEFYPDYRGGLAVAVATSEDEARGLVKKGRGFPIPESEWGILHVHELDDSTFAYAVPGGS